MRIETQVHNKQDISQGSVVHNNADYYHFPGWAFYWKAGRKKFENFPTSWRCQICFYHL